MQVRLHGARGLSAKRRGPTPKPRASAREIQFEREKRQLEKRFAKAQAVIEFQSTPVSPPRSSTPRPGCSRWRSGPRWPPGRRAAPERGSFLSRPTTSSNQPPRVESNAKRWVSKPLSSVIISLDAAEGALDNEVKRGHTSTVHCRRNANRQRRSARAMTGHERSLACAPAATTTAARCHNRDVRRRTVRVDGGGSRPQTALATSRSERSRPRSLTCHRGACVASRTKLVMATRGTRQRGSSWWSCSRAGRGTRPAR